MKTLSIFLALINSLMAGLVLAFSLSPTGIRQAAAWWSLTRITAAFCVVLIAAVTLLGSARQTGTALMALCSLFLVALGAATIVWTFHLFLVTHGTEFYMIVYGGSLIVQGMASLFGFVDESKNVTSV